LVAVVAGIISCDKSEEGTFVLTGTVDGADGKNIILEMHDDSLGIIPVDTAKIENGKFKFTGTAFEPSMHSLTIDGETNKSFLIVEDGEIDIEINKDSIFLNKISGTYNNEQLTEFSSQGREFQKKMQDFQQRNQATMVMAQNKNDTAAMSKLRADFQIIRDEMDASNEKYIREHPKAFISLLLISNMFRVFEPEMDKIETLYAGLDPEIKKTKAAVT